jgi:mono/diheme cytochrome c family protein
MAKSNMKKVLTTTILCLAIVLIVWSQPKKPVAKAIKKPAAAQAKTTAGTKPSLAAGQQLYSKICITCHQKDGGGVPRLNPPLIKTSYVTGDKARLIKIVLKGLTTPLTIDDEEYTNPMPAQPQLTDQQIADVLTYVRNSFGNKASAVTPAEVKAVRATAK